MFYGSIPFDVQSIMGSIVKDWDCTNIYVGCSGNFTVEKLLAPMQRFLLHSNDVTLYSSCLGNYLAGKSLNVSLSDKGFEKISWAENYTFLNPGSMKVSSEQFFTGGFSNPRNNTLFQYFRRMDESERAGTGGREIINVVSKNKYRFPDLKTDYKRTELRLWAAVPSETYEGLSNYSKSVLQYMDNSERPVTRNDIKEHTGLSDYGLRKAVNELSDKKLIIRKGKGRATIYYKSKSIIETFNMVNQLADKLKSVASSVK